MLNAQFITNYSDNTIGLWRWRVGSDNISPENFDYAD